MMTCETQGKYQHKNEKDAHYARRLMVVKNIKNGVIGSKRRVLQVYKCEQCGFFHVGHADIYLMK